VKGRRTVRVATLAIVVASSLALGAPRGTALPVVPALAKSSNVQQLGNVPTGPALGMAFKDH